MNTTTQQPEALRLARELEGVYPVNIQDQEAAAAELRRLHDENKKLRAAIAKFHAAKGRYHNQHAVCDLFDLCGLPNERPKK